MSFSKIKNVVGAIAPTLGAALGGPIGGAAGKIIGEVLGCDPTPAAIDKAFRAAGPEDIARIREAELKFEAKMKEMDVDIFELETRDKQDARSHFSGDWTARAIGLLSLTGFLGYIFLVTLMPPDQNSDTIVSLVLGYLGGTVSAVISFYFGASQSSNKEK